MAALLRAELASCDARRHREAAALYQRAIAVAGKRGFLHHQALANEREERTVVVVENSSRHRFSLRELMTCTFSGVLWPKSSKWKIRMRTCWM